MDKSLEGKVILITGANSGIGAAAATQFLATGATVYGLARRESTLDTARKEMPGVRWLLADVSDRQAVSQVVQRLVNEAGRLDVLVNNAGIYQFAPLEQSDDAMLRSQFEVNVFGVIYATQAALPALKESRGTIVNVGSAAGHLPIPGGSVYAATKSALESLTRSWALELASAGVRVNNIAPGPTDTPGFDKMGIPAEQVSAMKAQFTSRVPLGRMAASSEIARWIVTLAEPGAAWVTGQIFSVDGGMSLT